MRQAQKLLCPVAGHAVADHHARFHVERGEQRGRAVALVIMGHGGCAALLQRQPGLSAVKRLDLRLLIDAENDSPLGWIEVEADDLGDLLLEHRIIRDLEATCQVRLEPRLRPDTSHARWRNAHCLGHQGPAPVCGIGRSFLHRLRDHLEARLTRQGRNARGTGFIALQTGHALIEITLLPAPDRGLGGLGAPHDLIGSAAVRRRQHDAGAPDDLAGGVAVRDQRFELCSIRRAKVKADVISSHDPSMTDQNPKGNHLSGGEH